MSFHASCTDNSQADVEECSTAGKNGRNKCRVDLQGLEEDAVPTFFHLSKGPLDDGAGFGMMDIVALLDSAL